MKRNIGNAERVVRAVVGIALMGCAFLAPLPLLVRLPGFGGLGAYLLLTALAGTCMGYQLMGRSTCAARPVERA